MFQEYGRQEKKRELERELEERMRKEEDEKRRQALIEHERERLRSRRDASQEMQKVNAASALVIGNDLNNPNPVSVVFLSKLGPTFTWFSDLNPSFLYVSASYHFKLFLL